MPAFFTALLLVFLFYYLLGLAPAPLGRLAPMAFPPPERTGFIIIDASLVRDWAVLRDAAAHLMLPGMALAIAGIGPLTRKKLIRHFGSAKAALNADAVQLQAVVGANRGRQRDATQRDAEHSVTGFQLLFVPVENCFFSLRQPGVPVFLDRPSAG